MHPTQHSYSSSSSSQFEFPAVPLTAGIPATAPVPAMLQLAGRIPIVNYNLGPWPRTFHPTILTTVPTHSGLTTPRRIDPTPINVNLCRWPVAFHTFIRPPLPAILPHDNFTPVEFASIPPDNRTVSGRQHSAGQRSEGSSGMSVQSRSREALREKKYNLEPDKTQHRHPKKLKLTASGRGNVHSSSTQSVYAEETTSFVQRVIATIQKHSLLKTAQQLRDDEVQESLDYILPQALIDLVSAYVEPERCLQPLALDPLGDLRVNEVNTAIRRAISSAFSATGVNSELFRNDIIKKHQRTVLDHAFSDDLELIRAIETLDAIRYGDKQALRTRKKQIAAIVNYLPDSRLQETIQHKMAQLERLRHSENRKGNLEEVYRQNIERLDIDVQLLLDCADQLDPALRVLRQAAELRKYSLCQLNLEIDAAIENRDFINAQLRIMHAFDRYCEEGRKRGAIKLAIHFIELSRYRMADNFQEIIRLFEPIKALCLSYPADTDLFAELLFKIDLFARDKSEFSVAKNLYRQAYPVTMTDLPVRYQAKVVYRSVLLTCTESPVAPKTFEQVTRAINHFHQAQENPKFDPIRYDHGRTVFTEPKASKFKDVPISEFLRCFSSLYHIAARMINNQFSTFPALPLAQRARFCELLSIVDIDMDKELDYNIEEEQFLPLKHAEIRFSATMPDELLRHSLVYAIANCYKKALKILFDDRYYETRAGGAPTQLRHARRMNPSNAPFCISIMEDLVQLYVRHHLYEELNELMRNSFQSALSRDLPGLSEKSRIWRKSLRDIEKAQDLHWQSTEKNHATKKAKQSD